MATLALLAQLDAGMQPVAVLAALAATNGFYFLRGDVGALQSIDRTIEGYLRSKDAKSIAVGASLAQEYAAQLGWRAIEPNAQKWVDAAIYAANASPEAGGHLLALVFELVCGRESLARPEFHRSIVVPSVPKMAIAAADALEIIPSASLLRALAQQLHIHTTMMRPIVPRLHAVCASVLFSPDDVLVSPAMTLFAALPLSGAVADTPLNIAALLAGNDVTDRSKVSQSQLWLTSALELISATQFALHGIVSAPPPATRPFGWPPLDADATVSIPLSVFRLERLIGRNSPGLVLQFISAALPRAVPVPIGDIVDVAYRMITAAPSSGDLIDRSRLELWALPQVHMAGLQLLVHTVATFGQASWRFLLVRQSAVISAVCTLAERSAAHVRLSAVRALQKILGCGDIGFGVPLDPAHSLAQRVARVCVQQVCSYIAGEPAADADMPQQRIMFESDTVFLANRAPQDAITRKSSVETRTTQSAVALLSSLTSVMLSSTASGSTELVDVGVRVILGASEVMVDSRVIDLASDHSLDLAVELVRGLCRVIVANGGDLVSQILPRAHALFVRGTHSSIPVLRAACAEALQSILLILRPRLPPVAATVDSSALVRTWHSEDVVQSEFDAAAEAAPAAHKPAPAETPVSETAADVSQETPSAMQQDAISSSVIEAQPAAEAAVSEPASASLASLAAPAAPAALAPQPAPASEAMPTSMPTSMPTPTPLPEPTFAAASTTSMASTSSAPLITPSAVEPPKKVPKLQKPEPAHPVPVAAMSDESDTEMPTLDVGDSDSDT
ncbi:hypothetical protein MCUN1_000474 [Malassezia cuniculi]|uniref:Pre-rRNA-processing protein RIX1 N-terminal domain-containing protein n=1 Tax=Malassezia cuniculi TaxID=948313 RepID=A0AAF0J9U4_9BASI|nr:hypothetical protein MCUN1_000474 [Malassezia cuniculi]